MTEQVDRLPWNDAERLLEHAAVHGNDTAALLINPLDQTPLHPTQEMSADFVSAIEQVRARWGIPIIVDSVRHGFRLHPDGCHRYLGLEPDFMTLGKALGNGYSVSALLGTEVMRESARKILYTSTYMFESPPMRAAPMTSIRLFRRQR